VPDGVDPVDAAPLTCAGVTTYKAIKVAGTRCSDLVAVFGVGGLGHLALQYAALAGGRVIAVDLIDEKLELARELGAEFTVNAAKEDPIEAIQKLGGADQAISLAVSPRAFEQAYRSLRRGGKLVFSRCRRTTTSRSRSSKPCSTGSRSKARSWGHEPTSARCSSFTQLARPR
jgi:propanol-preferring alcohol dehydrogenase